MKNEINKHIKEFLQNCKNEGVEYKEAADLINKHFKGEKLTEDELHKLREQIIDSIKIAGITAYMIPATIIPFGYALLPFIIKIAEKNKINILPSSFKKK